MTLSLQLVKNEKNEIDIVPAPYSRPQHLSFNFYHCVHLFENYRRTNIFGMWRMILSCASLCLLGAYGRRELGE